MLASRGRGPRRRRQLGACSPSGYAQRRVQTRSNDESELL
jgi:hypothetical protein